MIDVYPCGLCGSTRGCRCGFMAGRRLRVGRKVGRTLYVQDGAVPDDGDYLIGMVDTPAMAAEIVRRWNAAGP
jgi:hypothetical protein